MWLRNITQHIHTHRHFMAIIQVNLCQPMPTVKKWKILLEQSLTARMPLLTATSAFRLGRTHYSFLHHPHTVSGKEKVEVTVRDWLLKKQICFRFSANILPGLLIHHICHVFQHQEKLLVGQQSRWHPVSHSSSSAYSYEHVYSSENWRLLDNKDNFKDDSVTTNGTLTS